MALYAALDIRGVDEDLALAVLDDYSPTAAEQHDGILTVFFASPFDRDRASAAFVAALPAASATARDVDDGDWARRSQQNLQPVTVGCITIAPPWCVPQPHPLTPNLQPPLSDLQPPTSNLLLIIEPSMGFGTGHHATTRLCLGLLQRLDLTAASVLDVGTGSGVLAMAARQLGAQAALGIDTDADAIRSADENLRLNPAVDRVVFKRADLAEVLPSAASRSPIAAFSSTPTPSDGPGDIDVVTANLTGALLIRSAELLINTIGVGGHLILSGIMQPEQPEVAAAFAGRTMTISATYEEEWVGLLLKRTL